MKKLLPVWIALAVVIIGVVALAFSHHPSIKTAEAPGTATSAAGTAKTGKILLNTVSYQCNNNKTIAASFYRSTTPEPTPAAGEPSTPNGSVTLTLGDGRTLTLAQTISADGARYSNGNPQQQESETIVFWAKGEGATITENNAATYSGCITVKPNPGNLPHVYENGVQGFSLRYPVGYSVNQNYQYQELGPGKTINGVSFTIPASLAQGTNLAPDSYISVERLPNETSCSANLFLPQGMPGSTAKTETQNGTTYSVESYTGAAAGNRYAETVYAIPGTNPCIAVRYMIHYGVLENYPAGAVKAFDQQALLSQFDAIRNTLTVQQ